MQRLTRILLTIPFVLAGVALPVIALAAPGCQDILIVYARGSGADFGSEEARSFFTKIDNNISDGTRLATVEVGDFDGDGEVEGDEYPAVPLTEWISIDFSDDYSDPLGGYDRSRTLGTSELVSFLNNRDCRDESIILGGHSQGAHVVGEALFDLDDDVAERVAYVALFGDPKFGAVKGVSSWARGTFFPWAAGIALPRIPYVPDNFDGKVASWCNDGDPICTGDLGDLPGLLLSSNAHYRYDEGAMSQAANEISERLQVVRPDIVDDLRVTPILISDRPSPDVDVTFVVDTTGSMSDDIAAAQAAIDDISDELFALAESPQVSLVEYRDQGDAYQSRVDVPFTGNRAEFIEAVNGLSASGGGDTPESVYSGLMTAFDLDWRAGAIKLAILIGDAPPKDPEPVTGFTIADVLETALELDPVVINPILIGSNSQTAASFNALADGSKGTVFSADNAEEVVAAIQGAIDEFALAPVAQLGGPYIGRPGEEVLFTGAASFDPDAAIEDYAWDFDNDGTIDTSGPSPVVAHAYDESYTGLAVLTVTSSDGGTAHGTAEVQVTPEQRAPQPPSAPRAVTATITGTNSVELTWEEPSAVGGSPIEGYRVMKEDGTLLALTDAEARRFVIANVPVETDIRLSVQALNEFGAGPSATSNPIRLEGSADPSPTPTASPSTSPAPGATPSPSPSADDEPAGSGGGLPITGLPLALVIAGALILITAGSVLIAITRHRRKIRLVA